MREDSLAGDFDGKQKMGEGRKLEYVQDLNFRFDNPKLSATTDQKYIWTTHNNIRNDEKVLLLTLLYKV